MMYFCTYFDVNYLPRALAMYNSLLRNCGPFKIYMLCFDSASSERLKALRLENAVVVTQEEFEAGDPRLVAAKEGRTRLEYYYTCSPSLPLFVLNKYPEVDVITYLDADLFFFSNPAPLLQELQGFSIGITLHNFPEYRPAPTFGKYNVGWLSFRRDENGFACLNWWREKCIEWCYERFEEGKYADQLYLDEWPARFKGVKVLSHKGANVAAWNLADYKITENDGMVMVSGFPLIFYHYHGFKQLSPHLYNTNLGLTFKFPSKVVRKRVFEPYINELVRYAPEGGATQSIRSKHLRARWIQAIRTSIRTLIGIMFRQYVVVINGKVY